MFPTRSLRPCFADLVTRIEFNIFPLIPLSCIVFNSNTIVRFNSIGISIGILPLALVIPRVGINPNM